MSTDPVLRNMNQKYWIGRTNWSMCLYYHPETHIQKVNTPYGYQVGCISQCESKLKQLLQNIRPLLYKGKGVTAPEMSYKSFILQNRKIKHIYDDRIIFKLSLEEC